jgi:hypothetical protein
MLRKKKVVGRSRRVGSREWRVEQGRRWRSKLSASAFEGC